jgi:hypothetical protein
MVVARIRMYAGPVSWVSNDKHWHSVKRMLVLHSQCVHHKHATCKECQGNTDSQPRSLKLFSQVE